MGVHFLWGDNRIFFTAWGGGSPPLAKNLLIPPPLQENSPRPNFYSPTKGLFVPLNNFDVMTQ